MRTVVVGWMDMRRMSSCTACNVNVSSGFILASSVMQDASA